MTLWSYAFNRIRMRCPAIQRTDYNLWCDGKSATGRGLLLRGVEHGGEHAVRDLLEVHRLHAVGSTAFGQGADCGRVTEHLGQRDGRVEDGLAVLRVDALDDTPAAVDIAEQVALVFVGVVTSTFMIGSKMIGPAFSKASLRPKMPAILNANSLESTSWKEPSVIATLMSMTW